MVAARAGDDSDAALMARVQKAADQQAFTLLLERHLSGLRHFLRRMAGSVQDADDLCQEAFVRVWDHRRRWRPGRARFSTWLYRIGHNLAVDALRRRRELAVDPEQVVDIADRALFEGGDGQHADPVVRSETVSAVRAAIDGLPLRQRTALTLCHHRGMSQREAAAVMDTSVEAIEALLSRARRRLRAELRAWL